MNGGPNVAIEMRACRVPHYDGRSGFDRPTFTIEEIEHEADSIGLQVLDIQRLQNMLLFCASLMGDAEAWEKHPYQSCLTCGYTAKHALSCKEPVYGEVVRP